MRAALVLLSLVTAGGSLAETRGDSPALLAVIAVAEEGVSQADLERLEAQLRDQLASLARVRAQERAETLEHLEEAQAFGIDCRDRDVECASKVGLLAGVDQILLLRPRPHTDGYLLDLVLVDATGGEAERRVQQIVPRQEEASALRVAAVRALAPQRYVGALRVQAEPRGAEVLIDGTVTEAADDGVIREVPVGERRVVVRSAGYGDEERLVEVRFEEVHDLEVRLSPAGSARAEPAPAEPFPALLVGGAGATLVGAALLAGGLGAVIVGNGAVANIDSPLEERRGGRSLGLGGLAVTAVGGAVLVAGAGLGAFALLDE